MRERTACDAGSSLPASCWTAACRRESTSAASSPRATDSGSIGVGGVAGPASASGVTTGAASAVATTAPASRGWFFASCF